MLDKNQVRSQAGTLATHLKAILTEPAPQKVRYRRRGRVDRKLIGHLAAGVRDDVMQQRRTKPGQKPPRVLIAVDGSGSMRGSGPVVGTAMEVWMRALEASKIPYATTFWVGGSNKGNPQNGTIQQYVELRVVKDWNESYPRQYEGKWGAIVDVMAQSSTPTQNALLAAVEYACEGVGSTEEIIIAFFTDGHPDWSDDKDMKWIADYIKEQQGNGIHIIPILYSAQGAGASKFDDAWPNKLSVTAVTLMQNVGKVIGRHVKQVIKGR